MKLRIASLILCLALATVPAYAQWRYDNGPGNFDTDAWTINFGYIVSDTFVAGGATNYFTFGVWEFPGDSLGVPGASLSWSISTSENGTPVSGGSGVALGESI